MTEREKMQAGLLYDCGDAELLAQWHKAKDLVRDYNRTDSRDLAEKDRILSALLGGRGKSLWITPPFFVDYGCNIFFGDNCEVNLNCVFLDSGRITVGDNALIAPCVQIYTAFHPACPADRFGEPKEDGSFGFCKTLTAPVTIGEGALVGAGRIVFCAKAPRASRVSDTARLVFSRRLGFPRGINGKTAAGQLCH